MIGDCVGNMLAAASTGHRSCFVVFFFFFFFSFLRNLSSSSLVLFFFFPYKSLCSRFEIIRSPSDLCSSLCSFISFSFLLYLIITSYRCIGQNSPEKLKKKKLSEPQKPVTVLRTVRSDHGLHGSLLFSHRTVLEAKNSAKLRGSQFFRLDRTVRSGFKTLIEAPICPK